MVKNVLKNVLDEQLNLIKPGKDVLREIKKITDEFTKTLERNLNEETPDTEVFVGGSFAKGTLVKKDKYDVDIFVRFDHRIDNISLLLGDSLVKTCKSREFKLEKIHGSRDYFKVYSTDNDFYFEIIPVSKIKKAREERNVTDLSYFHVSYVKRKAKKILDDILLAKTFCQANKIYGAESYIKGFSGYALECLIIHYGGFEKMLKGLSKVENKLVVDIENRYKKNDVFFEINESKLGSPVILVDPTYKERNALASLSQETFDRFKKSAISFLKNPNIKFFEKSSIDVKKMIRKANKNKFEFLNLELETDKQTGDIAGTKLKKFSDMLILELSKYFHIKEKEFEYNEEKSAEVFLMLKSKKEIIRIGPPLKMKKHVKSFKKEHRKTYEKGGYLHTKIKVDFSGKDFCKDYSKKYSKKLKEMSVINLKIIN